MTPSEMLRACADAIESGRNPRISITHLGRGRFPFAGGDTELLSVNDRGKNYSVSVARVLSHMAKVLKSLAE